MLRAFKIRREAGLCPAGAVTLPEREPARENLEGFLSPFNKKTLAGLFVFVCLPPVAINGESHESTAEPFVMSGGVLRGGCPRFSALLRFLVSPRNRSEVPVPVCHAKHKGDEETLGRKGSTPPVTPRIRGATLQSRENTIHCRTVVATVLSTHRVCCMKY